MVGWHHWLDGHEFEQTLGDGEGQESLQCFSPWGHKESDAPQWLNNDSSKMFMFHCRKICFGFLWGGPWPSYPARFHSVILSAYSVFLGFLLSVSQRWLKSSFTCNLPDQSDPGTVWLTAISPQAHSRTSSCWWDERLKFPLFPLFYLCCLYTNMDYFFKKELKKKIYVLVQIFLVSIVAFWNFKTWIKEV